jgi:hypothetical protein
LSSAKERVGEVYGVIYKPLERAEEEEHGS